MDDQNETFGLQSYYFQQAIQNQPPPQQLNIYPQNLINNRVNSSTLDLSEFIKQENMLQNSNPQPKDPMQVFIQRGRHLEWVQMVENATKLLTDSKGLLEILESVIKKIEDFVVDTQLKTKRIISDFEQKIISQIHQSETSLQSVFNQEQFNIYNETIKQLSNKTNSVRLNLQELDLIKTTKQEVKEDVGFIVKKYEIEGMIRMYDKIVGHLENDVLALQRQGEKSIDIVQISKVINQEVSTRLMSIDEPVKFVIQHGERIICNDKYFNLKTGQYMGEIKWHDSNYDGISLNDESVLMSHNNYAKMTHWMWQDGNYKYLKRKIFQCRQPTIMATNIKKNPYRKDYVIFCVMGGNSLNQINIDKLSFCQSKLVYQAQNIPNFIDYSFVSEDTAIIITFQGLVTYDLRAKQFMMQLSHQSLKAPMIIPTYFDIKFLPLIIINNNNNFETADVKKKETLSRIRGLERAQLLGQIWRKGLGENNNTYAIGYEQRNQEMKMMLYQVVLE
ncbi:UNKNOWN [Stylonychia lemnae]|uniref:Uncharacterized protein n=1 Tax=Stylonychia lemnae TaxID=5949 RepID=A0A078AJX7_STYLE|nr:UNKNOWN [Stylonychia lemnae]|eukprot:CDW82690.1 UNKNOWN [Stylonychia lemnae]